MKEYPIIFRADMVKSILEGRKTQTRRVIKPQLESDAVDIGMHKGFISYHRKIQCDGSSHLGDWQHIKCPYGQAGDRLWVRETWALYLPQYYKKKEVFYRADGEINKSFISPHRVFKWRPSIHMPRWASRILLEITEIRVERVQEITHDDCIREGIRPSIPDWHFEDLSRYVFYVKDMFRILWNSIHGTDAWERNDWVWVVSFKRVV